MGKSVFITETPEMCADCPLCSEYLPLCRANGAPIEEKWKENGYFGKPDWCPLKPVPEKDDRKFSSYRWNWYTDGYNACLKEIGVI